MEKLQLIKFQQVQPAMRLKLGKTTGYVYCYQPTIRSS